MPDYLNNLKIKQDGRLIEIPLTGGFDKSQSYEEIGGHQLLRMQSGKAVKQSHWTKLRTEIIARGIAPNYLSDLDYSKPMEVYCIAPRALRPLSYAQVNSWIAIKSGQVESRKTLSNRYNLMRQWETIYYTPPKSHKFIHQIISQDDGMVYLQTTPDVEVYDLQCYGRPAYNKSGGYKTAPQVMLYYYPLITGYCMFRETAANDGSNWSWSLVCEEA